jgi:DNA-binding MarR family transcriptional regulator
VAKKKKASNTHAEEFYGAMQEIVRRFQFRDVNAICEFGISLTECHTLELIEENGPMSVNDLAAALRLDKSTVSRTVAKMVDKKLIRRKAHDTDARAVRLEVTSKGRQLYESVYRDAVACYSELLQDMPEASREALIRSLTQVGEVLRRDRRGRA